jgi:hypothetical protein
LPARGRCTRRQTGTTTAQELAEWKIACGGLLERASMDVVVGSLGKRWQIPNMENLRRSSESISKNLLQVNYGAVGLSINK